MQSFLEKMLTVYWAQVTLVLAVVGFFVKKVLDDRSKRKEINHSFYQQNRVDAINRFLTRYASLEAVLRQLPVYRILNREISSTGIDNMISPPLNLLTSSTMELNLYFDSDTNELVMKLLNNLKEVNYEMLEIYAGENENTIMDANRYSTALRKAVSSNDQLLVELYVRFKKSIQ